MRDGVSTSTRRRLAGPLWASVLIAALIAAFALVLGVGARDDASEVGGPFGRHLSGLEERRLAADVPTMADGGSVHLHARLRLYVDGERIAVPAGIGIDPSRPAEEMAALHTHDDLGRLHVEAGDGATLGQFFRIWGVPFSAQRLGPHRATDRKRVRMWVDDEHSRAFGELELTEGLDVIVAYGAGPAPPDGD